MKSYRVVDIYDEADELEGYGVLVEDNTGHTEMLPTIYPVRSEAHAAICEAAA